MKKTMTIPRGLRNNNPLNIRHSADQWQGARREQTDKSFVQFESMAYGYRAAWKVLDTYCLTFRRERKAYTVKNIIARWAPPSENHTDAYVRSVVLLSGLGGNESVPRPLRARDLDKTARLIAAMTCVENGISYKDVDWEAIWEGYDLAFPGKRSERQPALKGGNPIVDQPFKLPGLKTADLRDWDEYWDWSAKA